MPTWRRKDKQPEPKGLPPDAVPYKDGLYFVPLKPRDEPKPSQSTNHPNFRSFADLSPEDAVAAQLATSAAARTQLPDPAAMPMKDAPPIQYGRQE